MLIYFRSKEKYNAKKVVIDDITFDSKKEANRYCELKMLERAGKIKNLELQKVFELIPAQYEENDEVYKSGKNAGQQKRGKCIEKAVKYIADFVYTEDGKMVVEDTKGFRTTEYILKRKMLLYFYGIRIKEV